MSSPLAQWIAELASPDESTRLSAVGEIYRLGRASGGSAIAEWWAESELSALLRGPSPAITVGLAVQRDTFGRIRVANGTPRLAQVPPDQDAEEFELDLAEGISLDILTTREPGGEGTIAKYLAKFGEGIQQVEYLCANVDRAAQILKEKFQLASVYPATRAGADGTRVNFFLVASPDGGKVLIELYETPSRG
jgi:methylmalonyl-CoA/ethylmalonyl-CoA epimerase